MKVIMLAKGRGHVLVDDEDYAYLNRYKWQAYKSRSRIYAGTSININGKWTVF